MLSVTATVYNLKKTKNQPLSVKSNLENGLDLGCCDSSPPSLGHNKEKDLATVLASSI